MKRSDNREKVQPLKTYYEQGLHCLDIIRLSVYNINRLYEEDVNSMEYISTKEAAEKWGISERRIQKLCEENRIPGVIRFSRAWAIPKDAEKPKDLRMKNNYGGNV